MFVHYIFIMYRRNILYAYNNNWNILYTVKTLEN